VDTCAICRSELAAEWNFCVHCGTPAPTRANATATVTAITTTPAASDLTTVVDTLSVSAPSAPALSPDPEDDELDPIPSAIRPEPVLLPRPSRRADARLVFGLAMAAVGLVVVIYALISLLGARG
jgi:hypothetical protein